MCLAPQGLNNTASNYTSVLHVWVGPAGGVHFAGFGRLGRYKLEEIMRRTSLVVGP